jgi:hypothetical protein
MSFDGYVVFLAQNLFEEQFLLPTRFSPLWSISQTYRASRVRRCRSRHFVPPLTLHDIFVIIMPTARNSFGEQKLNSTVDVLFRQNSDINLNKIATAT